MKTSLLLASALFACSGIARAETVTTVHAPAPHSERVPYEIGDLASEAGISDLRHRVRHAANRVCEPTPATFLPAYDQHRCYSLTLKDAFVQVDRAVAAQPTRMAFAGGSIIVRAR